MKAVFITNRHTACNALCVPAQPRSQIAVNTHARKVPPTRRSGSKPSTLTTSSAASSGGSSLLRLHWNTPSCSTGGQIDAHVVAGSSKCQICSRALGALPTLLSVPSHPPPPRPQKKQQIKHDMPLTIDNRSVPHPPRPPKIQQIKHMTPHTHHDILLAQVAVDRVEQQAGVGARPQRGRRVQAVIGVPGRLHDSANTNTAVQHGSALRQNNAAVQSQNKASTEWLAEPSCPTNPSCWTSCCCCCLVGLSRLADWMQKNPTGVTTQNLQAAASKAVQHPANSATCPPAAVGAGAVPQHRVQLHQQRPPLLLHLGQCVSVQLVGHDDVLQGLGVQPATGFRQQVSGRARREL